MNYAPVLITVYDRLKHFTQCIESLKANPESKFTDLYIVSDAPYRKIDEEKIALVREYISRIDGFKSVTPILNEENLGPKGTYNKGPEIVLSNHDRLIVSEDDNVFSVNFLRFINEGLEFYKDDPRIYAICGYGHNIEFPEDYKHDTYLSHSYVAWGYGIWRDKYMKRDRRVPSVSEIKRKKNKICGRHNDKEHYRFLLYGAKVGCIPDDSFVTYHLKVNDMYCVFPTLTKVKNIGMDGSGVHGKSTVLNNRQLSRTIDPGLNFKFTPKLTVNEAIMNAINERRKFRIKNEPIGGKLARNVSRILPAQLAVWFDNFKLAAKRHRKLLRI